DDAGAELDLGAGLARLLRCPSDHLWRRVHAVHAAVRPHALLRRDRERTGATTDVENRFARFEAGETHEPLAEGALPSEHEEPCECVVAHSPVQDASLGRWGRGGIR